MWGHDPKVEKHRINLYNLTNLSTIPLQSLTKSQNKKKLILFLFTYSSMYVALKKKKTIFFLSQLHIVYCVGRYHEKW